MSIFDAIKTIDVKILISYVYYCSQLVVMAIADEATVVPVMMEPWARIAAKTPSTHVDQEYPGHCLAVHLISP